MANNTLWQEAASTFLRRTRVVGVVEKTTVYKATTTNVDGSEIACYAESPLILEGLKRLHVHAIRR